MTIHKVHLVDFVVEHVAFQRDRLTGKQGSRREGQTDQLSEVAVVGVAVTRVGQQVTRNVAVRDVVGLNHRSAERLVDHALTFRTVGGTIRTVDDLLSITQSGEDSRAESQHDIVGDPINILLGHRGVKLRNSPIHLGRVRSIARSGQGDLRGTKVAVRTRSNSSGQGSGLSSLNEEGLVAELGNLLTVLFTNLRAHIEALLEHVQQGQNVTRDDQGVNRQRGLVQVNATRIRRNAGGNLVQSSFTNRVVMDGVSATNRAHGDHAAQNGLTFDSTLNDTSVFADSQSHRIASRVNLVGIRDWGHYVVRVRKQANSH